MILLIIVFFTTTNYAFSVENNTTKKSPSQTKKIDEKKIAYLTFDDGPNKLTPILLKILKKYKVKATFFMIGKNIANYNDMVKLVYKDGHSIGLHSMNHENRDMYKSTKNLLAEMDAANGALKKAIGITSSIVRIPYGSFPYLSKDIVLDMEKTNYRIFDWNVDSKDALVKYKYYKSTEICTMMLKEIPKYKTPIILLHERGKSMTMVPHLIEFLLANNYEIKPITNETPVYNFWLKHLN